MKITDGSVKVLVANYSTNPNNPIYVAIGYKFRDSIYTIGDVIQLVQTLNQTHGWHFRNRPVAISGTTYQIAEVYEEEQPLREVYPMEQVQDPNTIGRLNAYCLPIQSLGIAQELTTYVKQQPQQQVQQPQQQPQIQQAQQEQDTSMSGAEADRLRARYRQYLTDEEINSFGDLEDLSDNELATLESMYDERKGESLQKSLVKYELPNELSNYNLIYREEVLSKSVMPKEGQTQEDIDRLKHELGLRVVVEEMLQLPKAEVIEQGEDDVMSSFRFIKEPIDNVFERVIYPRTNELISAEVTAQSEFKRLSSGIIQQILTKYGSYTEFINQYVKMENNADILPPSTVEYRGISIDYRTVKFYNNYSGYTIGFVTETDEGEYVFLLGLFYLVYTLTEHERLVQGQTFQSAYNYLIEAYCKEVNLTGLNYNKMQLEAHMVFPIHTRMIGMCKDEGVFNYVLQVVNENNIERYLYIQNGHIINKMFGARYVLIGDNFRVNYLGENLVILPTTDLIYTTSEALFTLIDEKADCTIEPFPGYYSFLGIPSVNSIENADYRKVVQTYDDLYTKTKSQGYVWDESLTLDMLDSASTGAGAQPTQGVQQPIHTQAQPGVEVVDIFATQPQQVFNEVVPQKDVAVPQDDEVDIKRVSYEKDENGFILAPDYKNMGHIESIIDNIRRLCTINPQAKSIIEGYLGDHISVIHKVGESIGVQMSYTTDPRREDNQLDRHEVVWAAIEKVINGLGIGEKHVETPKEEHRHRILNGTVKELNDVFNSLDERDQLRMEKMIKSVIEAFKL